jgi:hypothetical protein
VTEVAVLVHSVVTVVTGVTGVTMVKWETVAVLTDRQVLAVWSQR